VLWKKRAWRRICTERVLRGFERYRCSDVEAMMRLSENGKRWTVVTLGVAALLLSGPASRGQVKGQGTPSMTPKIADVTGEYECTEARVAGKTVPCKVAQLSLKSDGKFELKANIW
jgi:hypothetical protein